MLRLDSRLCWHCCARRRRRRRCCCCCCSCALHSCWITAKKMTPLPERQTNRNQIRVIVSPGPDRSQAGRQAGRPRRSQSASASADVSELSNAAVSETGDRSSPGRVVRCHDATQRRAASQSCSKRELSPLISQTSEDSINAGAWTFSTDFSMHPNHHCRHIVGPQSTAADVVYIVGDIRGESMEFLPGTRQRTTERGSL